MVNSAPLYFLRQFRDPVEPTRATIQDIIAARFVIQRLPTVTDVPNGGTITFAESATLDLPAALGLHMDGSRTVPVQQTVIIEGLDFTVDLGKVMA